MRITKAHDYDLTGELVGTAGLEAGPTASSAFVMIR
jgi:hypothetical protein